jgi:hypothetical protein
VKLIRLFELSHIRGGNGILLSNFLTRKHDMYCITRPRIRAIQELVDARNMAINKTRSAKCDFCSLKITAAKQNIHVLRISNRRGIDRRDPRSDRVSTGNSVRDPRRLQGRHCA